MTLTTKTNCNKSNIKKELIDREQYIKIWGFMLVDLGLEKTELLVYAIIFSMYKYNYSNFTGSRDYLQTWCNSGKSTIDNALNSLTEKKLLIRSYTQFGKARLATYAINPDMLPECEMFANENRHKAARLRYEQKNQNID